MSSSIILEKSDIWVPDIFPVHSILWIEPVKYFGKYVEMTFDGTLTYYRWLRVGALCKFDLTEFPFDHHSLEILLTSLSYSSKDVEINRIIPPQPSASESNSSWTSSFTGMQVHSEWRATDPLCRNEFFDNSLNIILVCTVEIERQPQFYVQTLVVPAFIVSFLAIVGQHASHTPKNPRTNKFHLVLTTMMSMGILVLSVIGSLPRSGQMSRLMVFYYFCMIFVSGSTLINWLLVEWEFLCENKDSDKYRVSRKFDRISCIIFVCCISGSLVWFLYPML